MLLFAERLPLVLNEGRDPEQLGNALQFPVDNIPVQVATYTS